MQRFWNGSAEPLVRRRVRSLSPFRRISQVRSSDDYLLPPQFQFGGLGVPTLPRSCHRLLQGCLWDSGPLSPQDTGMGAMLLPLRIRAPQIFGTANGSVEQFGDSPPRRL